MADEKIDLNSASAEELVQLPGIGPVLAQRIVSRRESGRPFEDASEITTVSGIGERTYRVLADRLSAAPPSAPSDQTGEVASEEEQEQGPEMSPDDESLVDDEPASGEERAPEEPEEGEVKAIPPGESFSEEGWLLEPEAEAEGPDEAETAAEEEVAGAVEPVAEAEAGPRGEGLEAAEAPAAAEAAEERIPPESPEVAAEPAEGRLPPVSPEPRAEPAPTPPRWRGLPWLWASLLGGFLGMIFALVVWAGINGSLDVGHSRAVIDIKGQVNSLRAEVQALETDVAGLRTRLDALEDLTDRVEGVESAVADLEDAASQLNERTEALGGELQALSDELGAVAEDVVTLQREADRTATFFKELQGLLMGIFGEPEAVSSPTPTPEGD